MIVGETKEQERIISLINLYRPHNDVVTSMQIGRLIDGIRGQDKEFIDWLEQSAHYNWVELKRRAK